MSASPARMFKTVAMLVAASALASCAAGPCRKLRNPELASSAATPPKVETPQAAAAAKGGTPVGQDTKATPSAGTQPKDATVLVSKPDGSLQCGMGKGLSPEEMEKQLAGIKVYTRDKRPDGLMHIQVCGSPTGMINVYEIPAASLREAEARGFKKFESH